jgi:hypothetical protein
LALLESLKKGEEAGGAWLTKVIHIEHGLSNKNFDIAQQGNANGQNVIVQGSCQPPGGRES